MLLFLFEAAFLSDWRRWCRSDPVKSLLMLLGDFFFKCCNSWPPTEDVVCCKDNIIYILSVARLHWSWCPRILWPLAPVLTVSANIFVSAHLLPCQLVGGWVQPRLKNLKKYRTVSCNVYYTRPQSPEGTIFHAATKFQLYWNCFMSLWCVTGECGRYFCRHHHKSGVSEAEIPSMILNSATIVTFDSVLKTTYIKKTLLYSQCFFSPDGWVGFF